MMRKIWVAGIFAGMVFMSLAAAVTENPDQPQKGLWNFELKQEWAIDGFKDQIFSRVSSIAVNESGRIFVTEPRLFKVFVLDQAGNLIRSFGRKGEGPGELKMLWNVTALSDRLVFSDMGRLHFFDFKGSFINSVPMTFRNWPRAWLDAGRYISVREEEDEQKKTAWVEIVEIGKKEKKTLMKIDRGSVMRAQGGGMRLAIRDANVNPSAVTGFDGKFLYLAKNDKYEIKKIDLQGNVVMKFTVKGRKPKPLSLAFKKKRINGITLNGGRMPKAMADQMIKSMPDHCTLFNRIFVADSGMIYVTVSDLENPGSRQIDIFSPRGRYLYRGKISVPQGCVLKSRLTFYKDSIILFMEDEEGEGKLVKFKAKFPG